MTKEEFKTYIFNKINVSYVINKPRSKSSKVLKVGKILGRSSFNKWGIIRLELEEASHS